MSQACTSQWKLRPDPSVFDLGPYAVGRATLGRTPETTPLSLPGSIRWYEHGVSCPNMPAVVISPSTPVPVSVYYPTASAVLSEAHPINIDFGSKQKFPYQENVRFPLMLFAHARRVPVCPDAFPSGADLGLLDISQDFRRVETILRHVASHGCVVMAPDLSGLTFSASPFADRAAILVALYEHIQTLPSSVLARLDLNVVVLAGHSTGGGACLAARSSIVAAGGPTPVAVGVLAPAVEASMATSLSATVSPAVLMVIKGTLDNVVASDPANVYAGGNVPKMLVTIPGANHFGYTDICSPDNKVCPALDDSPGAIPRVSQQVTAGGFLAALTRTFAFGDLLSLPYLRGERPNTNLFAVPGVTVERSGV